MRAEKAEWAPTLAGGLSACGAEGSVAGLPATVPGAGELRAKWVI